MFPTTVVWNTSHSKKNWARRDQKCTSVFTLSIRYSCQILIELKFAGKMLEKFSNFIKILPVGAELFHAERRKYKRKERQRVRKAHMTKWTFAFWYFARALKEKRILNWMVKTICDFSVILNSFERYSDILLGPEFLHNWLLIGFISSFQFFFFIGPSRCVVVNICILPSKTQYMWWNSNYIRATCFGRETSIIRPKLLNYFNF